MARPFNLDFTLDEIGEVFQVVESGWLMDRAPHLEREDIDYNVASSWSELKAGLVQLKLKKLQEHLDG